MKGSSFSQAFSLQLRVLWALCLREIHGKHGKTRLGYLWVLFKAAFGIGVFWWVRSIAGFSTPHGLPLPLFLLMGFIPWFIFSGCLRMVMEAVRKNSALLTFPQVFPLDLYVSSGIVVWVTEVVVLLLFMVALRLAGYHFTLHNPVFLFSLLVLLGFFALGLGIVLSAIALYVPVLDKIVPMVLRVVFFTSGIFFSPSQLSGKYASLIYWNPLVSFIEGCRSAFVVRTPFPEVKTTYIVCVSLILLGLGLLLERYVRFKQSA